MLDFQKKYPPQNPQLKHLNPEEDSPVMDFILEENKPTKCPKPQGR